eukprot:5260395-Prymnesium_polylepis.1
MASLAQLGVATFAHQKEIMKATRNLLRAFDRKARTERANERWLAILKGGKGARHERAESPRTESAPTATGEGAPPTKGGGRVGASRKRRSVGERGDEEPGSRSV